MSVRRYFLNFAYLGTPFRGSQRQVKGGHPRPDDPSTVQGMLEMGLKYLNPVSDTVVFMASRTDAGVHALNTTCHFDLHRPENYSIFEPQTLTFGLNKFFAKQYVPIRILNANIVDRDFHSRNNAISRTYLYKLVIGMHQEDKMSPLKHFLPIELLNKVFFYCSKSFNIDTMREAAKLFEGLHDFRTFMGPTEDNNRLTRREIHSIKIMERERKEVGISQYYSWPTSAMQNSNPNSHVVLDIYFKGKGFLYNQVRRTAGTLLAAAVGRITLRDIKFMLEVPNRQSWDSRVTSLPAFALYLCEIEY